MIYLSGCTNDTIESRLVEMGVGLMVQPGNGYHHRIGRFAHWAADNGAFADRWTEHDWARWLAELPTVGCLFAVAPDVVGDAAGSLARGLDHSGKMAAFGFPVAIAAQDGAEALDWPWDDFDALFLGGSPATDWKVSLAAESLVGEARRRGKWVHMGRVNSLRRLQRARLMGCQSSDGTFLAFGPDVNTPKLDRFLRVLKNTPPLRLTDPEAAS